MNKIILSDLNLYENDHQLYVGYGDGFLSKIEGEDIIHIKKILNYLIKNKNNKNADDLYFEMLQSYKIEKDHFNLLIEWLKSNGIIYTTDDAIKDKETTFLEINILGTLANEKTPFINDLNKHLKNSNYQLRLKSDDFENIDFCLILSPILNKTINHHIFHQLYQKNVPHIYIDYAPFSVTLGPAINPYLKMHCMKCFFNRRISNTMNPNIYLNLIRLDNKQFRQTPLLQSTFYNTLTEWLANELLRLNKTNWEDGGILGKSKTINFFTDDFDVARILKTVGCNTCNERQVYRPLNG